MAKHTPAYRFLSIALVSALFLSGIPPFRGIVHEAGASWSPIPGIDVDNSFRQVWSNRTDPLSSLREEPRDIFMSSNMSDLDDDNIAEIVVGDASGWFYVYEYNGTDDRYSEVYSNDTGANTVYAVTCGNLDNDMNMHDEIIVGGDNNEVRIYEWNGTQGSNNYTLANSTNMGGVIRDLEVRDLDNDLQNELIVGWDGGVTIFGFNETYHFGQEFHYGTGQPVYSVTTGDFDGNFQMDIAVAEHNYSSIYIYEVVAQNRYRFSLQSPLQIAPNDAQRMPLSLEGGDVNLDGRSEIYCGDNTGEINVITTPNELVNMTFSTLDTLGGGEVWDIFIGDVDGDLNYDIYVAASLDLGVFDYEYYIGDLGDLLSYNKTVIATSLGSGQDPYPSSIFGGECDNDNKGDIVFGCFGNASDSMLFVLEMNVFDYDMAVTGINFPTDGEILPTGTYAVNATLKNLGVNEVTFDVNCTIMNSTFDIVAELNETEVSVSPGERAYVSFDNPPWEVTIQGTYYVNVTTSLGSDGNVSNDYKNVSVIIQDIYDLAVWGMNISGMSPYGKDENLTVEATIFNQGNVNATAAPVHLRINDSNGYYLNDTDQTVTVGPGNVTVITFLPDWVPPEEVNYTLNVSVMWDLDHNVSNNHSQMEAVVRNIVDVSADIESIVGSYMIIDPRDGRETFNTNSTIFVNGTVRNLGNREETFNVTLNITDENEQSVFVNVTTITLGREETTHVVFPGWNTGSGNDVNYTINMSVHEPEENQPTYNNYSLQSILVWDKNDLSASDIQLNRTSPVNSNVTLNINGTITNVGNVNISGFDVRLEIRNATGNLTHSELKHMGLLLNRSEKCEVTFQTTSPGEEGGYTVNVTVICANDSYQDNNQTLSVLTINDYENLAVSSLFFHGYQVENYYPTGNHNFGATVRNLGLRSEDFDVMVKAGRSSGNSTYLINDSMENGTGGWSHVSWEGDNLWHQVNSSNSYPDNHSADTSWWFGDEATGFYEESCRAMIYQTVDLRNSFYATVDFWINYSLELGDDYFHFMVNNDTTSDPYNASWTTVDGPYSGNSLGWISKSVNISRFAGQKIQVGFYVFSNTTNANYRGVYLDDVTLNATQTVFVHQNPVGTLLEPGANATVNDSFNFAQEDTYLVILESVLSTDEVDGDNIITGRIKIKDYRDMGATDTVITLERKIEEPFSYTFEPGGEGWRGEGANSDWATGRPTRGPNGAVSGINVWGTNLNGKYPSNARSYLLSPEMGVNWDSTVEYWIWHWLDIGEFDYCLFQVSDDGKSTWNTLRNYTGFSMAWKKEVVHLGEFCGSLFFRFYLHSNDFMEEDGVYMDDFKIISKAPLHAGENTSFNVTIENFGNVEEVNPPVEITVTDGTGYHFVDRFNVNTAISPGTNHTFPWYFHPPDNGTYFINFDTDLNPDHNSSNDRSFASFYVWNDTNISIVNVTGITSGELIRLGDIVEIEAEIRNKGTWDWEKIPVNFTVTTEKGGKEVVVNRTFIDLSIPRNETRTATYRFTVPLNQSVKYNLTVNLPNNWTLDFDFKDNRKFFMFFGLNIGETRALFGYVRSNLTGEFLSDVDVVMSNNFGYREENTTKADGLYHFKLNMEKGPYQLQFIKTQYIHKTVTVTIDMTEDLNPVSISKRKDVLLDIDNEKPSVSIHPAPEFAIFGDIIDIGVAFGDEDGGNQDHFFHVSSNISGEIEGAADDLEMASKKFSIDTSRLSPGSHRIYVNISDPHETGSAYTDVNIYEAGLINIHETVPFEITVRGLYGGNGEVNLETNTTVPDDCEEIPESYASLEQYAMVNVTGQGRLVWLEVQLDYDPGMFPPGSYAEDVGLFYFHEQTRVWTEVPNPVVDDGERIITVKQTSLPQYRVYTLLVQRDRTNPYVVVTEPLNGSAGVRHILNYTIHFSEFIDHGTVGDGIILRDGGLNSIPFLFDTVNDSRNRTSKVILILELVYFTVYRINFSAPLSDLAGNPVVASSVTFRTLERPVTTGKIYVRVVNETGVPVPRPFVKIIGFDNSLGGNPDGIAHKDDLIPGQYSLWVREETYGGIKYFKSPVFPVEVKLNRTTWINITIYKYTEKPWDPKGILYGNITDVDGQPLENVEIVISNITVITKYVRVEPETPDNITETGDGNDTGNMTGNNTGNRSRDTEGNGTEKVTETVLTYYTSIYTDPSGSFYIRLLNGTYSIDFSLVGYDIRSMMVNVSPEGKKTLVNANLTEKARYGYFIFSVVDSKGNIVKDAVVELRGEDNLTLFELKTDNTGFYRSINLPEGRYTISISGDKYQDFDRRVWLTAGVDGKMNDLDELEIWRLDVLDPPDEDNQMNSTILIAIVALIVILLIIGLAIFLVQRKKIVEPENREERSVLPFDDIVMDDLRLVGRKATSLGDLTSNTELPVPPGFALTRAAFEQFMSQEKLSEKIGEVLGRVKDWDDPKNIERTGKQLRFAVKKATIPGQVESVIKSYFNKLIQKYQEELGGEGEPYVAVRLSPIDEDLPDDLFTGLEKTHLNVNGIDNVLRTVKECYSVLFSDGAMAYRHKEGLDHLENPLAVVVQLMVFSEASGKMVTLNPSDGNEDQMHMTAVYGLSDRSKKVIIPSNVYLVNKSDVKIIDKEGATQTIMVSRIKEGGVEETPVPPEESVREVLIDDDIAALAKLAKDVEGHFKKHMEMVWARDERDSKYYLLMCRPEREWTAKKAEEEKEEVAEKETEDEEYRCPVCAEKVEMDSTKCEACDAEFEAPEKVELIKVSPDEEGEGEEEVPPPEDVAISDEEISDEEISDEEISDIDLGDLIDLKEEIEGDGGAAETALDLDTLDEDVSLSALDKMVSSILGGDEGSMEDDEDLPIPEELPEAPPEEPEEDVLGTIDDLNIDDLEIDDIDIDGETDLDIDLDDISIEDLEKSLDELGE